MSGPARRKEKAATHVQVRALTRGFDNFRDTPEAILRDNDD
jgi:hypothetical protein